MIKAVTKIGKLRTLIMTDSSKLSMDIAQIRRAYRRKQDVFTEDTLTSKEPFGQFKSWFDEILINKEIMEPNAMCLATSSRSGTPSARYVLLKGFDKNGFKFYTNRSSQKGRELNENPKAALVFYWDCVHRQVRVEGNVEMLSEEDGNEYFSSRPKESQLGACVSKQSSLIPNREVLVSAQDELRKQYENTTVPKPKEWGGYLVRPTAVEFWQGQSDRVHDRIRFRRPNDGEKVDNVLVHEGVDGWVYERLAP